MTSLLENPVLKSNFSTTEYATIESGFSSVTNHIGILSQYIQKKILPHINKGSFLDIGAGPGFIARELLSHFNEAIALDPNDCYESYYSSSDAFDKLRFVNKNFESADFNKQFDFILCSHVLYHVPQNYWSVFIQKILKLLSKKGKALLTLVAARGQFHDLCDQINHNYSNSQVLKSILKEIGVDYKTSKIRSSYFYKDVQEITNLLKMFVIDDCFLPEEYASLPDREVIAIDQRIAKFVDNCYDQEKNLYTFQIDEDYLQLHAD